MDKIRLGKFPFLNCVPIYHALEKGEIQKEIQFELLVDVPSGLNERLKKAECDMAPISSIAYVDLNEEVFLLPDLSISAKGEVKSVILFSQVPIEKLHKQPIFITRQSATSIALLKLLLKEYFCIEAQYRSGEIAQLNGQAVAGLAIGDAALRIKAKGIYPYQLDLGELWQKWTGLPFVFGVFAVRKEAWQKKEVRELWRLLRLSKKWGLSHLEQLARLYAHEAIDLRQYWQHLDYDLTALHLEGLKQFFTYLQKNGQIKAVPKIEFASFLITT